jgi:amino acid adenylation domain-containing protein
MSDIRELIVDLQRQGISLLLDGEQLKSRSAPGAIDTQKASLLRERKAEIISYLRQRSGTQSVARADLMTVPRSEPPPLSFAQRRVWLTDQLQGSSHYVISVALSVQGRLNLSALQQAMNQIVERHETLRTVYRAVDGRPIQVILPAQSVTIVHHDLREIHVPERDDTLGQLTRENAKKAFDLTRELMLRVSLVRLEEDRWRVLAAIHHIAADGASINIFLQEFSSLYNAACEGSNPSLASPRIQYADYAFWQHAQSDTEHMRAHLQFWARHLEGIPAVHGIPPDNPRPAVKGTQAFRLTQRCDAIFTAALKNLARRYEATLFMLLHAALSVVVARWSRSEDVVIGTPVSGRTHQSLEALIGFFASTVVLRSAVPATATFGEVLKASRQTCLQAYEYQDVPFESIVDQLKPVRSASFTPVFQILFSMLNLDHGKLDCRDVRFELEPSVAVRTAFDIDITASEDSAGISLIWDVDKALFTEETVHRMMHAFACVVAQAAKDPEARIADIDLLRLKDAESLSLWNKTQREYPSKSCVHALIEEQVKRTPDRLAVVAGDRRMCYRELNERANGLASALIRGGVKPADTVPTLLSPGIETVIGFLAIMKAGAAFAPLDVRWPLARVKACLTSLAARCVLVDALTDTAELSDETSRYRVDIDAQSEALNPGLVLGADTPIYAIHTSGSTGVPKAALNLHRGIVNRLTFMSSYFGNNPDEVVLQTTHPCFDSAIWQYFWPLTKGGVSVLACGRDGPDLDTLAHLITQECVTLTDFSPALLREFLRYLDNADAAGLRRLDSLRHLIVGGEEMSAALARHCKKILPHVRLHNFYGPSEASIGVLCHETTSDCADPVPIGRAIDNVQIAIVDEQLKPVPIGAPGELLLGGACVGAGYIGQPEATRRAFVNISAPGSPKGVFYRTGDLVRHTTNGEVLFLGRIDAQVKVRGFRIELGEVTSAICSLDGVSQVHVDVSGEGSESRIVAWVVPLADMIADDSWKAQLNSSLRDLLPDYMIPAAWVFMDHMPLAASGKIDRRALPAVVANARPQYVPPRTSSQKEVAHIFGEIFGMPAISLGDNFFDLGGNSLLAMQVVARVRNALGVELPLRTVFDVPGVGALGDWCERYGSSRAD